jgi:hypothetical protein
LYGYSLAINSAKTVQSITLPNNRNVVVLAVNASATGTTAPTPTPTPPVTGTMKSPVYLDGKFYWGGDWNAVPFNYAQAGAGVDGPGPVIGVPGGVEWIYWLPYPPHNTAGPATNGVNFDLSGLTYFTIAIKPSQAGALAQMQFFRADGGTTDIPYGTMLIFSQAKYGPATMVAGQWNVYKIPLADFGVSGWIYKFIVQQQGVTPQPWEIDQVGFE